MNIYIGNLPKTTNEETVRKLFEEYGEVTEIKLLKENRNWAQDENIEKLVSSIKSGCEIYLKDLEVLEKRTEITEFRHEIENVKKILDSKNVMGESGGNYDMYYSGEYCNNCGALKIVGVKTCNSCKPKPGKF